MRKPLPPFEVEWRAKDDKPLPLVGWDRMEELPKHCKSFSWIGKQRLRMSLSMVETAGEQRLRKFLPIVIANLRLEVEETLANVNYK